MNLKQKLVDFVQKTKPVAEAEARTVGYSNSSAIQWYHRSVFDCLEWIEFSLGEQFDSCKEVENVLHKEKEQLYSLISENRDAKITDIETEKRVACKMSEYSGRVFTINKLLCFLKT